MKRILSVILAIILLMSALPLSAYAAPTSSKASSGYYHQHMKAGVAKRAYDALAKSKNLLSTSFDLTELNKYNPADPKLAEEVGKLQQEILVGAWCWRYDHIKESDLFTATIQCEISAEQKGPHLKFKATIKQQYHPMYTASLKAQRDKAIKEIANKAKKEKTTYDKLRSIHDQIISMATYDHAALHETNHNSKKFFYAHSSLGILLSGTGVCESYSKIFKMVCDELGIKDCICLISTSHMWNAVKLDGKWYVVDATWDDRESGTTPSYTYFLTGDPDTLDGSSKDHKVDTTYAPAPTYATSAYRPASSKPVLAKPVITASNGVSGIDLSWDKVSDATSYQLQRRAYSGGKWSAWATIKEGAIVGYTDKSVKAGVDYQYKVSAKNKTDSSTSDATDTIRRLGTPTGSLVATATGIKLTWNKVAGATGYRVYRATYSGGKWSSATLLKNVNTTTLTDKTVKAGKDYRYTLVAYHGTSSGAAKTTVAIRWLKATAVKVTNEEKAVAVSWNKVAGATGYYVYRATYSHGKWSSWKKVKTVKTTTYKDTTVKNGTQYRYKVSAYYGKLTSPDAISDTVERLTAITTKVSVASGGIKVSWSKNESADGYYLYRRQCKNGKWGAWVKLGSTKKTAYTDKTAKKKINYQYTVRAVSGHSISAVHASKKVKR